VILPGASNKFWFGVQSLLGANVYWLVDLIVGWAVRKSKASQADQKNRMKVRLQ
jgi:hypothetical protein